jgi:hypothetical protein
MASSDQSMDMFPVLAYLTVVDEWSGWQLHELVNCVIKKKAVCAIEERELPVCLNMLGKLYDIKNDSENHLIFKCVCVCVCVCVWEGGGGVLYSKDSGTEAEFVKVTFPEK